MKENPSIAHARHLTAIDMLREFGSQFALIIFASPKRRLDQYLCHAMAENEEMAFVDSGPAVVVVLMR